MTKQECLDTLEKSGMDKRNYYLDHGEYERPLYTVRKKRGQDSYYIHARYYYYPSTRYPRKNGDITDIVIKNAFNYENYFELY